MDCQLKDINVYYEQFGEGRPIIMLHGWSIDHRHMVYDMEQHFRQRDGWKRIYPDLPGHGRTPGKEWITNQDQMLEVVLEFIDQVVPGQRLVLAGTSLGAYLARGVVYRRSALIDGLLLNVPMIVADDAKRTVPVRVTLAEDPELMAQLPPEHAAFVRDFAVVQSRRYVDTLSAIFPDGLTSGDPQFQAKIRDNPAKYAFSFNVDTLSETCPAPVLIITGRQDSSVGYRDAWEILENYPRATFVVLDRAGHGLGVEQESLFHALASEWLDRVEEYVGRPS